MIDTRGQGDTGGGRIGSLCGRGLDYDLLGGVETQSSPRENVSLSLSRCLVSETELNR